MRYGIWLLAIFCLACESKPLRATSSSEKATRGGNPAQDLIELRVDLEEAPLPLQSAVMLDESVQNCLRQALSPQDLSFSVGLTGVLNGSGQAQSVQVESAQPELKVCLSVALGQIRFAAGRPGPFRMRVFRPGANDRPGKGFFLDLHPRKKFE